MVIGGLPLLAITILSIKLLSTRHAGHAGGGDGLALAMMWLVAYAIAFLSLLIGVGYLGTMRARYHQHPTKWQWIVMAFLVGELVLSMLSIAFPRVLSAML